MEGRGRGEENCSLAEAREPQGWLVLTLHLEQHSLTTLAGTPRPRAGRASAVGTRSSRLQICPPQWRRAHGREGERQNRRLGAKRGPKGGRCGRSSGPPGLSLKRLPTPVCCSSTRAWSLRDPEHLPRALLGARVG